MNLKEAIKEAKKKRLIYGVHYVAADKNGDMYVYLRVKPTRIREQWDGEECSWYRLSGKYTGKAHWTRAIRKFIV